MIDFEPRKKTVCEIILQCVNNRTTIYIQLTLNKSIKTQHKSYILLYVDFQSGETVPVMKRLASSLNFNSIELWTRGNNSLY